MPARITKAQKREEKKKPRMKVSGKSVLKLKNILDQKTKTAVCDRNID